jgi:hypothetical protein
VPRRAIVRSTIVLENGQDAPVAVRIDGTSCECTSVELASQTVPPLGTTELAVALDTRNRTGQVRSEVALTSSWQIPGQEPHTHATQLTLLAEVDPERGLTPGIMQLPVVWRGDAFESDPVGLQLRPDDAFVFEGVRWSVDTPWLQLNVSEEGCRASAAFFRGTILIHGGLAPEDVFVFRNAVFVQGQLNGKPMEFRSDVRGEIRDIIYAEPRVAFWSRTTRGQARTVRILSRVGGPLTIDGVESDASDRVTWRILENGTPSPAVELRLVEPESGRPVRAKIQIRARDEAGQERTPTIRAIAP